MSIKRANWSLAAIVVSASLLAGACGGDDDGTGPPAPQPGQLTVNVSTSGSPGAAFKLTVTGEGISSPVKVGTSHQLYTFASGDTLKTALIGTVSTGELLKFSVPDVNQASSYRVTLNEVAGSDNALLSLGSFSVSVSK
jgi:hypothetical protein